ncbi:hypothetical protein TrRE_jg7617 [Triparma retinervis]|uniref:Uncharacterized protein n=1 Tax=Triparma retinervis TaxID=2557542 RepID=A0A9W7DU18_9STRA|nr:hypothetical protein TrRE_jg7617 [Triparma retinervis]
MTKKSKAKQMTKKTAHVKWRGKTIALGTFPIDEAEIRRDMARDKVKQWIEEFQEEGELPSHNWAKENLEACGIRQVTKRRSVKPDGKYSPKKKGVPKIPLTTSSKEESPDFDLQESDGQVQQSWFPQHQPPAEQQLLSSMYSQSAFMNMYGYVGGGYGSSQIQSNPNYDLNAFTYNTGMYGYPGPYLPCSSASGQVATQQQQHLQLHHQGGEEQQEQQSQQQPQQQTQQHFQQLFQQQQQEQLQQQLQLQQQQLQQQLQLQQQQHYQQQQQQQQQQQHYSFPSFQPFGQLASDNHSMEQLKAAYADAAVGLVEKDFEVSDPVVSSTLPPVTATLPLVTAMLPPGDSKPFDGVIGTTVDEGSQLSAPKASKRVTIMLPDSGAKEIAETTTSAKQGIANLEEDVSQKK